MKKRNKYNKAMKKIQFKVLSLIKMRKILFLTCFLAGMLVACDSDDEVIMIQPIDLTDSPVEVFFNSELLESEKFFFNNPFSPGGDDNIVYAINSVTV
jgi:hypothetical protein